MLLFEEPSSDPTELARDWALGPGMAIRDGVLAFSPGHDQGYCLGITRRSDFRDFSLAADVRIVRGAVGFVLRAVGPSQYYMVQFDLANNPHVVWFHTFTPEAEEGYRVPLVPSMVVPRAEAWPRMRVAARRACSTSLLVNVRDRSGIALRGEIRTTLTVRARSACGNTAARPVSTVASG